MFNKDNFYMATTANFTKCNIPTTECDYQSLSGSKYYYTNDGVIRVSNHWGYSIASCNWFLDNECYDAIDSYGKLYAGYCKFSDFKLKNLDEYFVIYSTDIETINNYKQNDKINIDCMGNYYTTIEISPYMLANKKVSYKDIVLDFDSKYHMSIKL